MNLRLEKITKKYGSKIALDNVSVEFSEGIYALLGPNGAGKTTMLHLITDIISPTAGNIYFNDEPISKIGEAYRDILGFLPQNPGFYNYFTGEKMLRYFACIKGIGDEKKRCESLLKRTNLWECRKQRVGGYSGGMKRRLGIAVSLLNDPKILVLDEPTAGLDPKERIRFQNLISELSSNRIVIYSTHIISDISSIADKIVLIKSGTIRNTAPPEELCSSLSGKVWNVKTELNDASKILSEYCVTSFSARSKKADMRIISDKKPHENAVLTEPSLDDVYLYYFGGEDDDK